MALKSWHYCRTILALALVKTGGVYSLSRQGVRHIHIFCVSSPATMFYPLFFCLYPNLQL